MESITINSSEINKDNDFNMSPKFHIKKREQNDLIKDILGKLPKVENMTSARGNETPNQFIIKMVGKFTLFQSYNSPIAMYKKGKTYIFKNWNYSTTTGKYRNQFLNETKKETLAKLKSGEYTAVDFDIKDL